MHIHHCKHLPRLAIQFFIISSLAILFADSWVYLFSYLTNSALPNWSMTGRWLGMLSQGQFYTTTMSQVPAMHNEFFIGLLGHYLIGLKFTSAYMLLIHYGLKMTPHLINGIVFGVILAVFPYLIQLPSMGIGIFGSQSPTPYLVFFRVLSVHIFYGLGLGVGGILAYFI